MDISDGHASGTNRFGQPPGVGQSDAGGDGAGVSAERSASREGPIHPRLLAVMIAARYYGLELDPYEFRPGEGERDPTAAALSTWAQATGMWAKALRLRWKHLRVRPRSLLGFA